MLNVTNNNEKQIYADRHWIDADSTVRLFAGYNETNDDCALYLSIDRIMRSALHMNYKQFMKLISDAKELIHEIES